MVNKGVCKQWDEVRARFQGGQWSSIEDLNEEEDREVKTHKNRERECVCVSEAHRLGAMCLRE